MRYTQEEFTLLKHLLILTTYGQIFYSQEFEKAEETVDIALTGGLMSAIYSMASETQREKISEFELVTSRILFKEERNDLLFVLTVDKRMDLKDTDELLSMLAKRFFEKYGEVRIDGLVLTDFEEDVTEIVNKKIWYFGVQKKKFKYYDYLATIVTTAILCWYIYVVFNIPTFIWHRLIDQLPSVGDFILQLLFLIGVIALPILVLYILFKYTQVRNIFRFNKDYLTRPTRASYALVLPNYFLIQIFISFALFFSFMVFAQGYFTEIRAYPLYAGGLLGEQYNTPFSFSDIGASDLGDQVLIGSITWFTWVIIFPLIYSLMLGEKKWVTTYKNSVFITSISIILLYGCLTIGGVKYIEAFGFDVRNPTPGLISYQLAVIMPLNIFFYGFLLFMGIGINRVTPQKTKVSSLLAIWVSIYLTLISQRIFFQVWAPVV